MERKEFIRLVSASALCTGAMMGLTGCASYRFVDAIQMGSQLEVPISGFEDDQFVLVRHPNSEAPIYLGRVGMDDYSAIFLECTHRQCTVDPAGEQFECPCHGSRFDMSGMVLEGPAEDPLQVYETSTTDNSVIIHL